jgi:hypothetical protein
MESLYAGPSATARPVDGMAHIRRPVMETLAKGWYRYNFDALKAARIHLKAGNGCGRRSRRSPDQLWVRVVSMCASGRKCRRQLRLGRRVRQGATRKMLAGMKPCSCATGCWPAQHAQAQEYVGRREGSSEPAGGGPGTCGVMCIVQDKATPPGRVLTTSKTKQKNTHSRTFFFALSRVSQYALHLHPHSPCIKPPRQVARRTMQQADPHNTRPWHQHQPEKRSDTGNQATPGPTS